MSLNNLPMNKQEAIAELMAGKMIRHRYFSSDEWMKMSEGYILFEDGNQCTPIEFWRSRTDDSWDTGWSIVE